jgi:hypothetical protein
MWLEVSSSDVRFGAMVALFVGLLQKGSIGVFARIEAFNV